MIIYLRSRSDELVLEAAFVSCTHDLLDGCAFCRSDRGSDGASTIGPLPITTSTDPLPTLLPPRAAVGLSTLV